MDWNNEDERILGIERDFSNNPSLALGALDYQNFLLRRSIINDEAIPSYDESVRTSSSNLNLNAMNGHHIRHDSANQSLPMVSTTSDSSAINIITSDTTTDISNNGSSTSESRKRNKQMTSLKILGLNFLNARQHLALAFCRDCVLLPPLYHSFNCFKKSYEKYHLKTLLQNPFSLPITNSKGIVELVQTRSSEHFIVGIWCLVSAYLSYQVIDGLMVRWIVTYQTTAAILRVLAMSLLIIFIEQATLSIFSPYSSYSLHTWILISCILTIAYILQNFVTSNLDLKSGKKPRTIDYYNITVFAVVPVGLASFVSMIAVLRALLILRLDLDRGFDNTPGFIF
ncbi:hypothetical protein WICMUC_005022 [Wickerhamomyces mucosus]|uniref:N-glycosylation protein EOS1 n=1 Tax=Wickerhamomyces mucosus TaxID=1378264 RepID=A0A9P8T7H3_9ASCO|nr:hypothetical protein WICMUC_005022 [Wickerhamomyces mucosus]